MIQRIQTVYLFIAAVLVAVANFFPLAHCYVGQGFYTITSMGVEACGVPEFAGSGVWMLCASGAWAASLALILYAIFAYKDRIKQMKTCVYAILAILVFYVLFGVEVWTVNSETGVFPDLGIIAELPLIALILIFLAGRAIKRDEDMVRAADRIR